MPKSWSCLVSGFASTRAAGFCLQIIRSWADSKTVPKYNRTLLLGFFASFQYEMRPSTCIKLAKIPAHAWSQTLMCKQTILHLLTPFYHNQYLLSQKKLGLLFFPGRTKNIRKSLRILVFQQLLLPKKDKHHL